MDLERQKSHSKGKELLYIAIAFLIFSLSLAILTITIGFLKKVWF